MEDTDTATTPAEPESASMNFFQRLAGVYFEPTKTFRDINIKTTWIGIFLISALVSMAFAYVVSSRVDVGAITRQALENSPIKLSEEQLNQLEARAAAQQSSPVSRITSLVTSPISSIIMYLIMAGIFLLIFMLMGAQLKYKKALATTIWGFAPPSIIQQILSIAILFLKEPYTADPTQGIVMSHLGGLVDQKAHSVLHSIASSIDLFSIWTIILLSIGFAAISDKKMTTKKAAAGILILWVLYILGKVGFRAVFSGITG